MVWLCFLQWRLGLQTFSMKDADIVVMTHISAIELGGQPLTWAFDLQKSLFG